jgi:hypothetical protein
MPLTLEQLNRATLARQMLLKREKVSPVEATRRAVALQAQEPASPYVALWNRIADFEADDLDEAFTEGSLVKASLIRITLHVVAAGDYTTFHEAMLPALRASRLSDARFRDTGTSIDYADALLPLVTEFAAEPKTRKEIEAMLAGEMGAPPHSRLWWAYRTYAPLIHAPVGGPWSFGTRQQFRVAPTEPERISRIEALRLLLERYLAGFGPASRQDFGRFTLVAQSTIKEVLNGMDHLVRLEGPDGSELLDLPDMVLPDDDIPASPRLLPMWDSVLLAHADRNRVLPDEYRKMVIRSNGDTLPAILVDGYVAGIWRPSHDGIEVTAFRPLSAEKWNGLAEEATGLMRMLADRDPNVYSRYGRWWSQIPGDEVRNLSGR